MNMKKNIFMFDVEATSLYGKGFAVAAIITTQKGEIIETFEMMAFENLQDCDSWVVKNVLPGLSGMPLVSSREALRTHFFDFYKRHKEDCEIWADCCYPVEVKFLMDIVKDRKEQRKFDMPYPLMDVSTIVDINIDRAAEYENDNAGWVAQDPATRKLKNHNPLDDCKASLHCLIKYRK
jgi:hypothetical protein